MAEDEALFEPFLADPASAGIFCDFDGTLARIVGDPAKAEPVEGAVEVLADLAGRYRRVGVISGRTLSFLVDRLGGHGLWLAGSYGLEVADDRGQVDVNPAALAWCPTVGEVATMAESDLAPLQVGVERKSLSVTLHFRNRPDAEVPARAWANDAAGRSGLAVHPGRMSFELLPPVESNKGMALAAMVDDAGVSAACFLGDDRGDIAAFSELGRMRQEGLSTLAVAVASAEAPPELTDEADLVVDGPEEVVTLLRRLLPAAPPTNR